ncbi:MAG: sulfotransferase [Planctomycetaceae bacterium]
MSTAVENGRPIPPVVHRNTAPVHVIGHGRSGTSVFIRLLRKYLQIAFGTESQFIVRYYNRLERYGDLAEESSRLRLVEDICRERWFRRSGERFGFSTTADAILADTEEPSYAGVLDATFRQLAKHLDMQRWGDKTPEYIDDLPLLYNLFPGAKYIHVVRDGRDVALSGFEMPFGEKNVFMAGRDWSTAIRKVNAFARSINAEQFLEIRYEDFLSEPREQFVRLIEFLEIDDSDGRLIDFIAGSISDDLMLGNFNKWRTRLNPRQIRRFDGIASNELQQYGYETSVDGSRRPSPIETAYWWLDNKARRLVNWQNIKDTAYRLSLRRKLHS